MDHFEVFGLPRKMGIDTAALQRTFYELQKRYHPDFQGQRTPEEQAQALDASARLNAAYRSLRDPIARVEYLVRLEEGRETKEGATVKPKAPPELLAEMLEIQEALAEAKAGGLDDGTRATLAEQRQRLMARQRDEEARVTGPLSAEWDAADPGARPGVLAKCKIALATRAYLRTVIDDLAQALGEGELGEGGEGQHVAHHRH
ncbi:MAG: Fe-S protein assembly co-chaperone HscB [Candidatus Rokubacteria bacterium]|nr:Fe-S protein assembly co-chaperone HscB [Candidatus Rokubacteria bacterium]